MSTRKTKTRPTSSAGAKPRRSEPAARSNAPRDSVRGAIALPPTWVVAIVLAVSIVAVYSRALHAPFIFDDAATVEKNSSIRSLWPLISSTERPGPLNPMPDLPTSGRPLVNVTFAMNFYFGKLNPVGYHVVNMVLHFLNALLLWAIVRRTLRLPYFAERFDTSAGWLAMAVALLWALHPLQTEAVIYVTQRTELMMAFFYLATFYCSLRYWSELRLPLGEGRGGELSVEKPNQQFRTIWLLLAVAACSAGMASKEVMVSAPLMVLLFERTFIAGSLKEALRRSWPLYAGLAATWLLLLLVNIGAPRGESAGFSLGVSAYHWWLTQAKVLLIYLKLVIWPSPLLLHYVFHISPRLRKRGCMLFPYCCWPPAFASCYGAIIRLASWEHSCSRFYRRRLSFLSLRRWRPSGECICRCCALVIVRSLWAAMSLPNGHKSVGVASAMRA